MHESEKCMQNLVLGNLREDDCLVDVVPCTLEEVYRRFRGAYCLHHHRTFETSVNFYENTWRNTPEGSHLHARRRDNLKSHLDVRFQVHLTKPKMASSTSIDSRKEKSNQPPSG
jgi:hypothetical protein